MRGALDDLLLDVLRDVDRRQLEVAGDAALPQRPSGRGPEGEEDGAGDERERAAAAQASPAIVSSATGSSGGGAGSGSGPGGSRRAGLAYGYCSVSR